MDSRSIEEAKEDEAARTIQMLPESLGIESQQHTGPGRTRLIRAAIASVAGALIFGVCFLSLVSMFGATESALIPRAYMPEIVLSVATSIVPPGISILPNHTSFVDNDDQVQIIGEVSNTSTLTRAIYFEVRLLDPQGHVLDKLIGEYAHPPVYTIVFPNDRHCFSAIFPAQPSHWSTYQISITRVLDYNIDVNTFPQPINSVVDDITTGLKGNGDYQITGRVTNDEKVTAEIYIDASLYDVAGKLIGCASAPVNNARLMPGESSYFRAVFTGRSYVGVASHRIQPYGYHFEPLPPPEPPTSEPALPTPSPSVCPPGGTCYPSSAHDYR